MTVADAWQRRGVGACLIRTAITVAKGEGVGAQVARFAHRLAGAQGESAVQLAAQACDRIALFGPAGLVAEGDTRAVVTRENLAAAFGLEAEVQRGAGGGPLVVRRLDLSGGEP